MPDISINHSVARPVFTFFPVAGAGARAKITNHVFLGNISEYYASLPSGPVLRVQTHPLQHFKIGDEVAVEVDATQCSVFRRSGGEAKAG